MNAQLNQVPAWVKHDGIAMIEMLKDGPKTKMEMTKFQPHHIPGPYTTQCVNEAWRWLYQEGYFQQAGTTQDGSQWLYKLVA
jgi:hypothetical protein